MKTFKDRINKVLMNFMAYSRNEMNNQLASKVLGGMHEYAKCTLASKNGLFKLDRKNWISHWCREYVRLIGLELLGVYVHDLKGKFNRDKILLEVIDSCKTKIGHMITCANNEIKRDFHLPSLGHGIDESDFDHFWSIINMRSLPNVEDELDYQGIPEINR